MQLFLQLGLLFLFLLLLGEQAFELRHRVHHDLGLVVLDRLDIGVFHLADNVRHRLGDQFVDLLGVDDVDLLHPAFFERVDVDLARLCADQVRVVNTALFGFRHGYLLYMRFRVRRKRLPPRANE